MEVVFVPQMLLSTSKNTQCHKPEFHNLSSINKKKSDFFVTA
jgi:hypothetical protein